MNGPSGSLRPSSRDPDAVGRPAGAAARESLLHGNLWRAVTRLAGPMMVSAVLQNAQSLIDLFWVGRLGSTAVAALTLSGTILMLLFPALMGLATGTVALVARAIGAGQDETASDQAGQSLSVGVIAGVVLGLAGLPLMVPLCRLLGAPPEVIRESVVYLRISLLGLFSSYALFVGSSALQGAGNTVTPMAAMLLANILNLILDPLFIFGFGPLPAGGVAGAALATVLSQVVATGAIVMVLFSRRTRFRMRPRHLVPRLAPALRLLRIGVPSMGQMLARSLMGLALFRIVAGSGTDAVAGYGIGLRFHMVLLMPCFVLGNAAATLVGQNLGAGQPARARRAAWTAAAIDMAAMALSALLVAWVAEAAVALFDDTPAVVIIGASYLRTVTPFYMLAGLSIVIGRALNGAGCTVATMVLTVLVLWGLQVPLAAGLARVTHPPTLGVWYAIGIATTVHALLSVIWFETGRWQRQRV